MVPVLTGGNSKGTGLPGHPHKPCLLRVGALLGRGRAEFPRLGSRPLSRLLRGSCRLLVSLRSNKVLSEPSLIDPAHRLLRVGHA